jgi:hypothetical protein
MFASEAWNYDMNACFLKNQIVTELLEIITFLAQIWISIREKAQIFIHSRITLLTKSFGTDPHWKLVDPKL